MLGTFLLTAVSLLGQVPESPSDAEFASQVRQLVRQLDANQLAQREAAEKALIELGPAVLDHLPEVTPRTPAEVKQRLGRVLGAVQTAAAEAVAQSSRVTLKGEFSLQEAAAALERQTGNQIAGLEGRTATVKADLQDVPFWDAVDTLLDQVGLTINRFGGQPDALVVSAAPDNQRPRRGSAHYQGVFRIEPVRIQANRDLRNPQIEGLRLTLEIAWEPRITPISLTLLPDTVKVVDGDGQPLDLEERRGPISLPVEGYISAVEMEIPMELPDREVRQIASLQGTVEAILPGRVETFEFTDLPNAENDEQHRAGVTVSLERLRKNRDLYELYIRVRFDEAANALESHRGWIYNNDAYLMNAAGQRIEHAGFQATRQAENEVGMAYLFALDDPPETYKFVYETPAMILQTAVPFQLKDIPLP